MPDYDGRGNPDSGAGSWAFWIPRIALSPLYVVNEYVLRRPLGTLIKAAERDRWANTLSSLFTWGHDDDGTYKYLLVPTAAFDFGLLPSVGLYFAADDMIARGNTVRIHAATWGVDWINATAFDRYMFNGRGTSLAARVDFTRQADLLFLGLGPDVTSATRSRYGLQRFDTGLVFKQSMSSESSLTLSSGVRTTAYRPGDCCGDPSLDARIADGTLAAPPGYGLPYTSLYQRADVTLDTRLPRPTTGTGGYLQMHVESNVDVRDDRRWIELGGVVGIGADLDDRQRTLKAQVGVDYVDPIKGMVVPFNELASLSTDQMPGFIAGWMSGRSTFSAQVAYTWPVWTALDGQARFSTGNAFGEHLDGFAAKKLRLSADIGLVSVGKRDQGFEVLFGVGTETLEQGAGITSVRVSVGSRKGF